jgi:serine/threonine protein kinase
MSFIINNKYNIIEKIGSGSFGSIYKGQNIRTQEYVAIKVEPIKDGLKLLKNESNIYQYLNGCNCIPNIKWFGKDAVNYYMVINLLGPSLQNLMEAKGRLNLILTLKIGIKLITILKTIHDKGLVHRDIKPDNFLFGANQQFNSLYLIDFGFCKSFIDANNNHIESKKTSSLIGSKSYASINSHDHFELSRHDDLEGVCYILIYLSTGTLPWKNSENENEIKKLKIEILNNTFVSPIIIQFLRHIRSMKFAEPPNYYYFLDSLKREIEILSKKS